MARDGKHPQARCAYCGRYFQPDYRVKDRQRSCKSERCRAKRKKESQRRWVEANPGYFKGRYENTNQWRRRHPDYQRQWRAKKRREIQDEIILAKRCGCGFYVGRGGGDTRRDCAV